MGQIAVGEAHAMITDLHLDNIAFAPGKQLHVSGTMAERVVDQVTQGVLQSLPVC